MRTLSISILSLAVLAWSAAGAQVHSVVTFDSGSFGWHWNGNEWIDPAGGNPGAYLHSEICCSYWPLAFNDSSFAGNYRMAGLASLGIDLATFDAEFQTGGRPVTLMLRHDSWGAFVLGPGAPEVGAGWVSYDFLIPSQETSLPAGWQLWNTTTGTWDELIQDVQAVWFIVGDPTLGSIESDWVMGMDNARFVKGDAGRVPPDMVIDHVAGDWIKLIWSAPTGCGSPEDYAVYEGELGDWTSHAPAACTDEEGDHEQRILASPGNRYYLVVPLASDTEGSYGVDTGGQERPPGEIVTCRPGQSLVCS